MRITRRQLRQIIQEEVGRRISLARIDVPIDSSSEVFQTFRNIEDTISRLREILQGNEVKVYGPPTDSAAEVLWRELQQLERVEQDLNLELQVLQGLQGPRNLDPDPTSRLQERRHKDRIRFPVKQNSRHGKEVFKSLDDMAREYARIKDILLGKGSNTSISIPVFLDRIREAHDNLKLHIQELGLRY